MVGDIAIQLRGVTKKFGNLIANNNISFIIKKGTIHGIIGENGAGKSTLMKMIYGMYSVDSGAVEVWGKPVRFRNPTDAVEAKIGMVHQHFMLADPYLAIDNLLLSKSQNAKWYSTLNRASEIEIVEQVATKNKMQVDWRKTVGELPVGVQQRLEILKLLAQDSEILILDEPTAVLTPQETQELFATLKGLRDQGKTVIIISHKLKEIMNLTDNVTVIRRGEVTGERKTSETNISELAEMMVGQKINLDQTVEYKNVQLEPTKRDEPSNARKHTGLCVQNLSMKNAATTLLKNISFDVNPGEIVGIAGVEGNGQSDLIRSLLLGKENSQASGSSSCDISGSAKLFEHDLLSMNAQEIRSLPLAYFAEDRLHQGLLLDRPAFESFLLGFSKSSEFFRSGWLQFQKLADTLKNLFEEYDVRPRDIFWRSGSMSGGNQQKLVVARELHHQPKFLLAAQPTRGVDIGAVQFIHNKIVQTRDNGAAVLLVSSELDELMKLSDRILVLYKGEILQEFKKPEFNEIKIGAAMGGAKT